MKEISLKTRKDVQNTRAMVIALESCACSGAQAGSALTEQSFVLEDMAAMLPLIPEFSNDEQYLYQLTNKTIATSLDPDGEHPDVQILPQINTTTVATEDFDKTVENVRAFNKKVAQFAVQAVSVTKDVHFKLQKGYLWLTEHKHDLDKKLSIKAKGELRDTTIVLHGWGLNGEGINTIDGVIKAGNHFVGEQLPTLVEYCKHALFVMNEADEVMDDALGFKLDEQRLTRLYKAHTAANVEKIFGGPEYEVQLNRHVTVTETPSRARTDNEKILAVTSVKVDFDNEGVSTYKPTNTASATTEQAQELIKIVQAILKVVDVTDPNNAIAQLRRTSASFEKRVAKLEQALEKAQPESEEDERNYRTIVDAARMFSALRLQAMNFSLSTYSTATVIAEQMLAMIKIKE